MCLTLKTNGILTEARLAQSAERKALNLVVVGSSPTVGVLTGCVSGCNKWEMKHTGELHMMWMRVDGSP